MEYNKIIAVTGLPGLHELLSSKADGAIVRALDDKTTRFVSSRIHNFSHLESIEVYTIRDNVNLVDILKAMETSSEKLPDEKDSAALKNYFSKVYPDLDFDRVYSSDLKKMVKWYSVLKANNIEIKLSEPAAEEALAEEVVAEEKPAAPKKKAEKVEKAEKTEVKTKSEAAAAKAEEPAEEKPKAKKAATAEKAPAAGKAAAPAAVAKKKAEKTEKAEKAEEKPKKAAKKK
jgi:hypothetical protein